MGATSAPSGSRTDRPRRPWWSTPSARRAPPTAGRRRLGEVPAGPGPVPRGRDAARRPLRRPRGAGGLDVGHVPRAAPSRRRGRLVDEGEGLARLAGAKRALVRVLALDAYRCHDPAQLVEALRLSEVVSDPAPLCVVPWARGDPAEPGRRLRDGEPPQEIDALDPASVPADRQLEFRAILALNTGRLGDRRAPG